MYENKVYEVWEGIIRGVPTEYHKRLADRAIACLGNWLDEDKVEDVICDLRYHKRQIEAMFKEDLNHDRYELPYIERLKLFHKQQEEPQALNIS